MMSINIKINVICKSCGCELEAVYYHTQTISVMPCKECVEEIISSQPETKRKPVKPRRSRSKRK